LQACPSKGEVMHRFLLIFSIIQILFRSNAESICRLDIKDFTNYINAKQRISVWLVNNIVKDQELLLALREFQPHKINLKGAQLLKHYGEFDKYLRAGLKSGYSQSQLKDYGISKGFSKSIVVDSIFVGRVEQAIPEIKMADFNCNTFKHKNCTDSVKAVLSRFGLSGDAIHKHKYHTNKKHCEF
jgi:hypothetical protein